jgi:hypothetical protein
MMGWPIFISLPTRAGNKLFLNQGQFLNLKIITGKAEA